MADNYRELVGILKYLLTQRFAPMPHFIRGLLGDGAGNVLVPNRPDYNYARFNRSSGEVFEVFNKEVSQPVDGWPILIGEFPWQPGLTQVVGTDWSAYSQTGWGDAVASVQSHAPTHEWPNFSPGSDYLSIYMRAISPLRGRSGGTGTLNFYVNEYEYDFTGTNVQWPGTSPLALAAAAPATGTMRYMGVYLNPATNALGAVTGSTTTFAETGEPARPNWPLNVFPVAYARLYGGQAYFVEQDIRDARRIFDTTLMFTGTSAGGGSGGWPFDNVKTVSQTDAQADFTTFTSAIAAASAGDVILGDAETTTENITVNKAVSIIGHPGGTVFNSTGASSTNIVITAAGAYIGNLILTNSGTGLLSTCITWNVNNVTIKDVICTKTDAATTGTALYQYGGTSAKLINVEATASGATNNYAYRNDTADSGAEIRGGRFSGTTQDIFSNRAGSTLTLVKPILVNQLISWPGTISGFDYIEHGVGVYNSADLTISNSTGTALTFNSERWDTNGFHSTVSNTSRLTVPDAFGGRYLITASIRFDTNGTGVRQTYFQLNGTTIIAVDLRAASSASQPTDVGLATIYPLAAGDYVECIVFQNSGGDLAVKSAGNYTPEFRMEKIS